MNNFTFHNPVKIVFGQGTIGNLDKLLPNDAAVLMIYGGGSIKKNGVYEQVTDALKNRSWKEFPGIEPNPHFETCMKAVELIRKEKITYLLAVGGGSVIDATKFISAAACFEGNDAWDILAKGSPVEKTLPFGCILTLPATGSEMNNGAVITRASTREKLAVHSELFFPVFSILDPITTYSLPDRQTANGIIDAFVHVCEQYLTYPVDASIQDRFAESILQTLIEEGPKTLKKPDDYNARANVMWAATMALNGLISCGVPQDWATHMIGHEITAFHGLDHAQTLAVVLPALLKVMKKGKEEKLLQLGERVFEINIGSIPARIDATIEDVETFFRSLGAKTKLGEYGLTADVIEPIAKRFESRGWILGERQDITPDKVREILKLAL